MDVWQGKHRWPLECHFARKGARAGKDILVVLVDEFGFTSRATFEVSSGSISHIDPGMSRAGLETPFSSSPTTGPSLGPSPRSQEKDSVGNIAEDAEPPITTKRLFRPQQEPGGLITAGAEDELFILLTAGVSRFRIGRYSRWERWCDTPVQGASHSTVIESNKLLQSHRSRRWWHQRKATRPRKARAP
jgi:hypothetical protein